MVLLLSLFSLAGASDLWVELTGDDAANNCLDAATPCATLAHALTQSNSGDEVHLGAGTFSSAAAHPIRLVDGVTVSGMGSDLTRLYASDVQSGSILWADAQPTAQAPVPVPMTTELRGLSVDGDAFGAIELSGIVHATLEDVVVDGSSSAGLLGAQFYLGGSVTMRDCRLTNNTGSGLSLYGWPGGSTAYDLDLDLQDVDLSGNAWGFLLSWEVGDVTGSMADMVLDGNTEDAFEFTMTSTPTVDLLLSNTTMNGNGNGLFVSGGASVGLALSEVTVDDNLGDGVEFNIVENAELTWNGGGASRNQGNGVELFDVRGLTLDVRDAAFDDNLEDGVGVFATGTGGDFVFDEVSASRNGPYGLQLYTGAPGTLTANDLDVRDNGYGVEFSGYVQRASLVGSTIQGNDAAGLFISATGSTSFSLQAVDNVLNDNESGIELFTYESLDATLLDNETSGNDAVGIALSGSSGSSAAVVLDARGHRATDNGYAGMLLYGFTGTGTDIDIRDAVLTDNTYSGLEHVVFGAGSRITHSTLQGNAQTVSASSGNDLYYIGLGPMLATDNWWGTLDNATIADNITDGMDSGSSSMVVDFSALPDAFTARSTSPHLPADTEGWARLEADGAVFVPRAGTTRIAVEVDGVAAAGVEVAPDGRSLYALLPAHPAGTGSVVVTNPGGQSATGTLSFAPTPPVTVALSTSAAVLGDTLRITAEGVPAGANVRLLASVGTGAPWCAGPICTALAAPVPLMRPATGTGGPLTFDIPLPAAAPAPTVAMQLVGFSGGFFASNVVATPWLQAADDEDGDGLDNATEATLGTDALRGDSDRDGCRDGEDAAPLAPSADVDDNGLPDDCWN